LNSPFALALQIVFWVSALAVGYTYMGYPIVITVLARFIRRPVRLAPITPSVSLIIPVYNEERIVADKLDNSLALDYPRDKLEIVVVTDGSTDGTNRIAASYADRHIRLLFEPPRRGKIAALNRAVPLTRGEIVVFSDANAMLEPSALRYLVRNFADERVACAGGEKRVRGDSSMQGQGESAYWRYESYLKRCDNALGAAIGAIGELFAVRRERYTALEEDCVIEDFVLSLCLIQSGWRVVFEPKAVAWEQASPSLSAEWRRRTRSAAGGFQAIGRLKGMLNPFRGLPAFQYMSHKVMRWLAPFFMIAAFVANVGLWPFAFYRWMLALQVSFYLAAVVGYLLMRIGLRWWPLQLVFYFCFTNATALAGFYRYVTGSQPVTWEKVRP
jgi:cellulose synthase/poly-beta-1,6-N-acetylglucosamine synthase-like glycosyltransferase